MEYLATFHTHYGAMRFYKYCKKNAIPARMLPVPRDVSASCGTGVRFEAEHPPSPAAHEDMEACYAIDANGAYIPLNN